MHDQIILACDDSGRFTGEYLPKAVGHTGAGRRHLAIAVLIDRSDGSVLLQRRRHPIFDDIWDLTGATHPLHLADHDESFIEATERCLEVEYSIPPGSVALTDLGGFPYFAQDGDNCENEFCHLLVGTHDGPLQVNDDVAYGIRWVSRADLLREVHERPETYAAWAVEGVRLLERKGYFTPSPSL